MANYVNLFWQVQAELPGVPKPLLLLHYAEATREFFRRSLAWQYNVPGTLDLNASTAFPTLTEGTHFPNGSYIIQPVKVKWDGVEVPFKTRDQLDEIRTDWETDEGSAVEYWTITSPGVWTVVPMLSANSDDRIKMRLALAPEASATSIPDALANEFQSAFANGALARLLKIQGKDWTNEKMAASYQEFFERDIREARSRAAADFGRPQRTVRYGGLSIGGSGRKINDDYGQ